ncbi:MAG TPA: type VI secretion system tube protein Hcp [Caulobacteraceae bacterium]|nr:type VI secretion system tube protein Hcp [Caulobacteraceae bacterium]
MALFMQVDGIKGSATEEHHTDWISIQSFQWGVGRGISSPTGASSDRETSVPSVSEIVITKPYDASTSDLFSWSLGGSEGKKVVIELISTGHEDEAILHYELENTLISGFSQSSGGDGMSESISLNFTKVTMRTMGVGEDLNTKSPVTVGWDLGQQKKV